MAGGSGAGYEAHTSAGKNGGSGSVGWELPVPDPSLVPSPTSARHFIWVKNSRMREPLCKNGAGYETNQTHLPGENKMAARSGSGYETTSS